LQQRQRLPHRALQAALPRACSCAAASTSGSHSSRSRLACGAAQGFLGGAARHGGRRLHQRGACLVVRADTDFYSVLGVDRNADKKAIKQAYR
jgi:hypothetical protein